MAVGAPGVKPLAEPLRKRLLAIDGVVESPGIFGQDDAFWVNGREMAYFTKDSAEFGLRLTRAEISARRAQLESYSRVVRKASSDWLHMRLATKGDVELAAELAEVAVGIYRAAPGTTPALPPSGAKLERMRRFH